MNRFLIKLVAMITMVVDHIGVLFFPEQEIFRIIGRISFPLFTFLIVEGFMHTSDIKKYVLRIGIFAIISEIPFDMTIMKDFINTTHQNVLFTFFIGLIMLYLIDRTTKPFLTTVWLALAFLLSMVFMSDYSYYGIAIIYLFYYLRQSRVLSVIGLAIASFLFGGIQVTAVLAAPFILLYNGERGPAFADGRIWKYSFYIFYPLHMLVLFGIHMFTRT